MRQPYFKTITGTAAFAPIEDAPTSMRLLSITATGENVQVRLKGDTTAGKTYTLADGEKIDLLNIDLNQVEVHAPSADVARIYGSPH